MKNVFGPKKLTVLFGYMLLLLTKKSALKSKDFYTLCAYTSLGKRGYTSDAL